MSSYNANMQFADLLFVQSQPQPRSQGSLLPALRSERTERG